MKIKCYIWGNNSDWEGLCTSYDIATQGESSEEVRISLEEMINDFLEDVKELQIHDRNQLLRRKSPLHLRFLLEMRYVQSNLLRFVKRINVSQDRMANRVDKVDIIPDHAT